MAKPLVAVCSDVDPLSVEGRSVAMQIYRQLSLTRCGA